MRRSRRAFLRAAALAGSVGIAGCGDGGNTRVTAPPDDGNGGTATATATATAANGTATGTATADGTPTDTPTETPTATPEPIGSNETWRTFQNDLANTGSVALNHSRFVSSTKNWSITLDSPVSMQPAFDENQLYVPTRNSLHAVDRETQQINWTFESPESPMTTPIVPGDGFVYAVSSGGVYQIHARDGWTAFTFPFNEKISNLIGISAPSPPTLVGNTILFNIVVKTSSGSRTVTSRIVSLTIDGNRRWSRDLPTNSNREARVPALGLAPTPAVDSNGRAYVVTGWAPQDATLYGINTGGGGVAFGTDYTGKGWSSITLKGSNLYFADRYVDVFTRGGNKVVRRTVDPPPNAYACAAGSDYVFMPSRSYGGNEGKLFAIGSSGGIEWTFEGEGNLFVPTTTENLVYVVSASGSLFALDQSAGVVRWEQDLGLSTPLVSSAPVVSTDEIFLTAAPQSGTARLISISPTS